MVGKDHFATRSEMMRMYTLRPPRLPRHPLLRLLVLVAGAVLLAGLVTAGLLVGTTLVAVGALTLLARRWLGPRSRGSSDPDVIEGEFTVVSPRTRAALPRTE